MICKNISKKFGSKILRKAKMATGKCLQHNPEKTKYRCSPENRRSNGESVAGRTRQDNKEARSR